MYDSWDSFNTKALLPVPSPFLATRLRRGPSFHRLTRVGVAAFYAMLERLRAPWDAAQRAKAKEGRPHEVGGQEDHLLVMLVYYRCYVTRAFPGCF